MKPKRKSENISPPVGNKAPKRQQKMSTTGKNKGEQHTSTQQNVQPTVQTPIGSATHPQQHQFYYPNVVQNQMGLSPPYFSQQMNPTPVPPSMPYGQCNDILQSVLDRLDTIDKKLGQLNSIQTKVDAINNRLDSMDLKILEIERSQSFICDKYDHINSTVNSNTSDIEKLQVAMEKLKYENTELKNKNDSFSEELIDMKCRSMKDNLLFFGVPEGNLQIPSETLEASELHISHKSDSTADPMACANGDMITENTNDDGGVLEDEDRTGASALHNLPESSQSHGPVTGASYSAAASMSENCQAKVLDFCKKVLKIHEPNKSVKIIVAHRIGKYIPGKIRPIVARLEPDSKNVIKSALKTVKLKTTPYNVSDQYPQEVKEKRKQLIPELIKARREGKTAFLRRDKLIIQQGFVR